MRPPCPFVKHRDTTYCGFLLGHSQDMVLSSPKLIRKHGCLVGEAPRKRKVLHPDGVLGLLDESLGRFVLRPRIRIERPVVDSGSDWRWRGSSSPESHARLRPVPRRAWSATWSLSAAAQAPVVAAPRLSGACLGRRDRLPRRHFGFDRQDDAGRRCRHVERRPARQRLGPRSHTSRYD